MAQAASHPAAPLAVTMGDPAGIGLEITLKAWAVRQREQLAVFCVYGSADALAERARTLSLDVPIERISAPAAAAGVFQARLPVIDIALPRPSNAGQPTPENAGAVITAITRAVEEIKRGAARAIVTNPIAKSVLYASGFSHPGHTEFLGALANAHWPGKPHQPVMMIASDKLKVVPLTIHVPLANVPGLITPDLIASTVRVTAEALKRDFGITRPRIAVAGLNPHAGEDGSIGREDREIIAPALASLAIDGVILHGPVPADTMFHAAARATYDAAICMYHDQALIPAKTLAFDEGVNVTLGLPFVRTSPDHGTAFGIAGQGSASARSLIEALKLADRMAATRAKASA